ALRARSRAARACSRAAESEAGMSAKRTADTPAPGSRRGPFHHVSVRLQQPTIDRVDALIPAMSTPWCAARRSDVLRAVIVEGLEVLEARPAAKPKGWRASGPDA